MKTKTRQLAGLENRQGRKSLGSSNLPPFANALFLYESFDELGGCGAPHTNACEGTKGARSPTESTQKSPHRNKPIPELSASEESRFWAMVDRRGPDECWPWKGAANARGYGRFKIKRRALYEAHGLRLVA